MLNPLWTKTERKYKSISNCASWWRLFRMVSCDRTKTCLQVQLSHDQCGLLAKLSQQQQLTMSRAHPSTSLVFFLVHTSTPLLFFSQSEWMKTLIRSLYLVWVPCSEFNKQQLALHVDALSLVSHHLCVSACYQSRCWTIMLLPLLEGKTDAEEGKQREVRREKIYDVKCLCLAFCFHRCVAVCSV